MPGAARAFQDSAGGTIIGGAPSVLVNGFPVSVMGDGVVTHGENQHEAAAMMIGSPSVLAGGLPVVRMGDPASCGHIATGSANVIIG